MKAEENVLCKSFVNLYVIKTGLENISISDPESNLSLSYIQKVFDETRRFSQLLTVIKLFAATVWHQVSIIIL